MSDKYLIHWGVKKGEQSKHHKYLSRISIGNTYRYFYNQAELSAYKAGKAAKNIKNNIKNASYKISDFTGSYYKKQAKALTKAGDNAKHEAVDDRKVANTKYKYYPKAKEELAERAKTEDHNAAEIYKTASYYYKKYHSSPVGKFNDSVYKSVNKAKRWVNGIKLDYKINAMKKAEKKKKQKQKQKEKEQKQKEQKQNSSTNK